MKDHFQLRVAGLLFALTLQACGGGGGGDPAATPTPSPSPTPSPAPTEVTTATADAIALMAADSLAAHELTAGLGSNEEARLLAMVAIAAHDAANRAKPHAETYLGGATDPTADANSAAARAAHDVLTAELPDQLALLDTRLAAIAATVADGSAETAGDALGASVALAMRAERANDGVAAALTKLYLPEQSFVTQTPPNYGYRPNAGEFKRVPVPDSTQSPPYGYPAPAYVGWGSVKPFALTSGSQFRAAPPYGAANIAAAIQTPGFLADYKEAKCKGVSASPTVRGTPVVDCSAAQKRTADEAEIAYFWRESSPKTWGLIAANVNAAKSLAGWERLRLGALMYTAMNDALIASYDSKYTYNFWRPLTAVHFIYLFRAAESLEDWRPFDPVTPATPDYTSAHAAAGGAAEIVLANFFGDATAFSVTSSTSPVANKARSFTSFSQAAVENGRSRVFVGYHFNEAVNAGLTQGRSVAGYTLANRLRVLP